MENGLLIASIVAVVAIVGLVILLSGKGATGDVAACQMVVSEEGVGYFMCKSNYVGPTFETREETMARQVATFDRFTGASE